MKSEIIVAVLALIGTLAGTFGGIMKANQMTNYRIEQLEKKQDKYNNVIERTFRLEEGQAVFENRMKVQEHRMEDAENEIQDIKRRAS